MKILEDILIRTGGEIVVTEKVTVGNSFAIERRSLLPGDDYSQEDESVRLVCQLVHSEDYLNIVIPPTNTPNWDSFNAYMLTDTMFKSYRDTVRPLDGELNSALFDAYGLVSSNGVAAFSLVWGQWVAVSGIVDDDRLAIASVAEGFNLPTEFVDVLTG